jgi:precorrin-3B C17-methyltransferase
MYNQVMGEGMGSTQRTEKGPEGKAGTEVQKGTLYILGIGPGNIDHLSQRACQVLESVDAVAGYTTYIDLVRPLIQEKQIISTGMTKEVQRVEEAIDQALEGKSCALISSGDPGIYAMSGLVFEMCQNKNISVSPAASLADKRTAKNELQVEIIPGIPALCAGASLLGSPISHDFAVISLSDLLTPWEVIEKRIEGAAMADFVLAIYNPKSKKRDWQLQKAQEIILKYRSAETPVGIVVSAMREEEHTQIVSLGNLHKAEVNMQTIIFVGNKNTETYLDFMVTPRGYSKKYSFAANGAK